MNTSSSVAEAFGYLSLHEINFMKPLIMKYPSWSTVVNIGAGSGTSGLVFAECLPLAMRFTVDISMGGPLGGLENERNAFEGTGLKLPIQVLGDSHRIGAAWFTPLDILFIDADHSYAGITGDMEVWIPSMKAGGLVMFHDYGSPNWPDVKIAVDEKMKDHEFIGAQDTLAAYKIKEQG